METVNHYYSLSYAFDEQDQDLLNLCRACARSLAGKVQWASRGHAQAECEYCGASNDEAYSREQDAIYQAITGAPAPDRPGARR